MAAALSYAAPRPHAGLWRFQALVMCIRRARHRPPPIRALANQAYDSFVDGALGMRAANDNASSQRYFDVIFLGTGTSEGIPRVSCLTNPYKKCEVCWAATKVGNKNRRRNTSILVRYPKDDGKAMNILIDAGKFFYHSALQWFPYYGIRYLDAVVITHSHADAVGGLDDLRDWTNNVQDKVPIYLAQRDFEVTKKTHYYLVDPSGITQGTAVSKLHFELIDENKFSINNLQITPLPVWHGPGYRSLGFRIHDVCYISDASEIPDTTYPLLEGCELFVIDALRADRSSSTHFSLAQALDAIRRVKPKRALLTGMMHTMDHDLLNTQLSKLRSSEGLDVQLSYDGMKLRFQL